jgi:hypothetical protein
MVMDEKCFTSEALNKEYQTRKMILWGTYTQEKSTSKIKEATYTKIICIQEISHVLNVVL